MGALVILFRQLSEVSETARRTTATMTEEWATG